MAPFGRPVVPLVYCRAAMSSRAGRGCPASSRAPRSSAAHATTPAGSPPEVSAARELRAFAIGSRSIARVPRGISRVMSTPTMVVMPSSSAKPRTVSAVLSHTMATRAP